MVGDVHPGLVAPRVRARASAEGGVRRLAGRQAGRSSLSARADAPDRTPRDDLKPSNVQTQTGLGTPKHPEAVRALAHPRTSALPRQRLHRSREQPHLRCVARARRIAIELRGERRERAAARRAGRRLGGGQRRAHGREPRRRQSVRPLELIDVRARQREARRPDELRLTLRVQVVAAAPSSPRRSRSARCSALGVSSKTSSPRAISELTIDAVVPVHRPRAAHRHARRVDRAAIEERDLLRIRRRRSSRTPRCRPDTTPAPSRRGPGIGISEPLCATQFSCAVCAAGSL